MRIAIVGAGVSGNVCAGLLHPHHDVTLYEANAYPGGHTNTIRVDAHGGSYALDTGFMVFNDRTYPEFTRLLEQLGIEAQDSDMSFSVRCDRTGLEYQGSSLSGLFAQRGNLVNPRFYRMLWEIARFNRLATQERDALGDALTMGEYLAQRGFGKDMVDRYLVPMTAAIWSACPGKVLEMPARFLLQFFHNHGLLQLNDRPQWKTIPGGACRYVAELLRPLGDRVRLSTPVASVTRVVDSVELRTRSGDVATYDAVVFACHSDQALRMLADADSREREVLEYFPYQHNLATVHTDTRLLPRRRAAWASWNYRILPGDEDRVCVTYDVNRLQRLGAPAPICVTLNDDGSIDPGRILAQIDYHHPVFQPGTLRMQQAQHELNGRRQTYFCGAYWGYGFHEDGVRSALAVVDAIGRKTERDEVSRLEGQRA